MFMAWDNMWTSSFGLVASGTSSYYLSQHPQCDFYFGFGRDVIDEDALNVESCVQVLRILITKADTEIQELEKDLLLLQNELECVEHEKWPDVYHGALNEKINRLDVAVSTLKNDCADDAEMQLLLDGEPAEALHEIAEALLRDHCRDTLAQHLDMNTSSPIVNDTEHAVDKDSSTIDSSIIIKEEGKELHGTSESSDLPLVLHERRSDNPEKIEELPEKSPARSPDLGAIICASDHSDELKLSEASDNEVTGNEEARRSKLINTDTGQILGLFSAQDNGNIPSEVKKENEFVKEKDVSSDDFRPAIAYKGRKKFLHSRLGTSQQQKSKNSDLDKKLCDFASKAARRACKKESGVAPDEDLNSLNLPLQVVYPQTLSITDTEFCSFKGSNGNKSEQVINIENSTLIHAENSALISLLGTQTKSALYTEIQLIDEEKQEAQDLKSKIAANLSKSRMSFPSKIKDREKQKRELEAYSSREPNGNSSEVIPSTSRIASTKRQRKSKPCADLTILTEPTNWKINSRRAVQPDKCETQGCAMVLYDRKFSESQKKRKVSKVPTTLDVENSTGNLDVENSDRVSMDNTSKLHSLVDSHNESSPLPPGALDSMTLSNLRTMAKQHNVHKYYKLRKGELVEQLVQRLNSC